MGCELGGVPEIAIDAIRPPYSSEWPRDTAKAENVRTELDSASYSTLRRSLGEMGDFRDYVLRSSGSDIVRCWVANADIASEPAPPEGDKEAEEALTAASDAAIAALSLEEREQLKTRGWNQDKDVEKAQDNFCRRLEEKISELPLEMRERVESMLVRERQCETEREAATERYEAAKLDREFSVCWIFERVKELGWTFERFGEFDDRYLSRFERFWGRGAHKPERIGKKYQWIALHELLAKVTDHRPFRRDWGGVVKFSGMWDSGIGRDIDPTSIIEPIDNNSGSVYDCSWWFPVQHFDWRESLQSDEWLRCENDIPDIRAALMPVNEVGTRWLSLDGYVKWQSRAWEDRDIQPERRSIGGLVWCYLVRSADRNTFCEWAKTKDFMNRWMPEGRGTSISTYWREVYWAPSYKSDVSYQHEQTDWVTPDKWNVSKPEEHYLPCEVLCPSANYLWERGQGYDCSGEESLSCRIPSDVLARCMGIRLGSREGECVDRDGGVVFQDPSVWERGPRVLLVKFDALQDLLQREKLSVVWTSLFERTAIFDDHTDRGGRTHVNGVFWLDGDKIYGGFERVPRSVVAMR